MNGNTIEYKIGDRVKHLTFIANIESEYKFRKAVFKCNVCSRLFITTLNSARQGAKSCGCKMFKVINIDTKDAIMKTFKNNPFVKLHIIAKRYKISIATAWRYKQEAYKQM